MPKATKPKRSSVRAEPVVGKTTTDLSDNSSKPAQLRVPAYAQGSDIHVARNQKKHLPHEAWHVVQQAQGRVKATLQLKAGVPLNQSAALEKEADVMGARAIESDQRKRRPGPK